MKNDVGKLIKIKSYANFFPVGLLSIFDISTVQIGEIGVIVKETYEEPILSSFVRAYFQGKIGDVRKDSFEFLNQKEY